MSHLLYMIRFFQRPSLVFALLFASSAIANNTSPTQRADALMEQWIQLEKQNTQLKSQWQENKQLLEQRISLLQREKKQLQALDKDHHKQVDEVSAQRQKLITLQTSMESTQQDLTRWLDREFSQINNVLPQLPPPLANTWQLALTELDTKNPSNRLETLLSLYQSFDEFNKRISTNQATIIDAQGNEKVVKQLYLGVARGWYLTLDSATAVAGMPTAQGWQWQHESPLSPTQINAALAMIAHKKEAALIKLPMRLGANNASLAGEQ
ncbi:DUF3450 domain-containing protein [Psychrobium sp. MM17-31]|uniref:DUF3450 family protein n=1 Tax=Psychrobium sp. MM17-31 TaxID=2917758 RepID=UPI001EF3E8DE|nr:DUF3450 family protein [Psychrobium sp. MM17-31]MCG7533167.1 DUF3450 domain-containing protein [Psychrobium sp. MM17-31]